MNKYIITNIKFLNVDHQIYIYNYIKTTDHSINNNGSFFKLSDLSREQTEFIYNFMKKIENNQSDIDKKRDEIMTCLEKELSLDTVVENSLPIKYERETIVKPPINQPVVDMKEIEEKIKNFGKLPKYKPGSVHDRISKIMKRGKKTKKTEHKAFFFSNENEAENEEDSESEHEEDDIGDLRSKMLKLLVSKGYSLTDNTQLKNENYLV